MIMNLAWVQTDSLVYYRTGFEFSPRKFSIKFMSRLSEICPGFYESELKYTESDALKVLGLKWNPVNDCFSFDSLASPNGMIITKRLVLSFIARLFDPLGFLTPFSVKAKIIFQQLWVLGIEWTPVSLILLPLNLIDG